MNRIKTVVPALISFFALIAPAWPAESAITSQFKEALYSKDLSEMFFIVNKNRERVPAEVKALVDEALRPDTPREAREERFYVAEFMANEYKNATGDINPLKEAKKRIFESKLTPQVRIQPANGVYIIEAVPTDKVKNKFTPDNIIIKKGETVRWVNNDPEGHVLASVPVIGMEGILSPAIEQGKSWEFKFEKSGEYYYICCMHTVMFGKITVVE